jgi:hypothetical protein
MLEDTREFLTLSERPTDTIADELATIARRAIRHGFSIVPFTRSERLVAHECTECAFVACAFAWKTWNTIATATVVAHKDGFPLLSEDAKRYYLPAWMLAYIDDARGVDTGADAIIAYLTPPRGRKTRNWEAFAERAQLFNGVERDAIYAFLTFVETREPERADVAQALAFWSE